MSDKHRRKRIVSTGLDTPGETPASGRRSAQDPIIQTGHSEPHSESPEKITEFPDILPDTAITLSILDSLPANVALVSSKGEIVAVNASWKQFADENYSFQQYYVGSNYFDTCESAAAAGDSIAHQALQGLLSVIREERDIFELQYPCHSKNKKRWFLMRANRAHFKQPMIIVMHLDITARVEAEIALRASEERYRLLYQHAGAGIGCYDLAGTIVDFNEKAARSLGGVPGDFIGKDISVVFGPELSATILERMRAVAASGQSAQFEDLVELPIGQRRFLSIYCPVVELEGQSPTIQIIAQDLTDLREIQDQLRTAHLQLTTEHELLLDKHTTLREVLLHIEDERNKVRVNISENVRQVISPLIRSLKKLSARNQSQLVLLDRLEKSLEEVSSPFVSSLSTLHRSLTPREVEICSMVRDGLPSKEIADFLGISVLTVSKLRQQIRRKLSIDNRSIGLSEFLQSL